MQIEHAQRRLKGRDFENNKVYYCVGKNNTCPKERRKGYGWFCAKCTSTDNPELTNMKVGEVKEVNGVRFIKTTDNIRITCKGINEDGSKCNKVNYVDGYCPDHFREPQNIPEVKTISERLLSIGVPQIDLGNEPIINIPEDLILSKKTISVFRLDNPELLIADSKIIIYDSENINKKGHRKGDKRVYYGRRQIHNGIQWTYICKGLNDSCKVVAINDGFCKKHSEHWRCKFSGLHCTRIRTHGNYCKLHEGGVQQKKKRSLGEIEVIRALDAKLIKYDSEKYIKINDERQLRLDFYLPDYNYAIEYDGKQHYRVVGKWKGKEGLRERQLADKQKNEWCAKNKVKLLRIPYWDFGRIEELVEKFIQ